MGSTEIGLLAAIIGLLILAALCSAAETAFTSANKIKLATMEQNGNKGARKVLRLIANFDRMLSTILAGNNIMNITIASVGTVLFARLMATSANAATIAPIVSTVVITVTVLFFGEITPKNLARVNPEKVAIHLYTFTICMYYVLFPINLLFRGWSNLINKIFKIEKPKTYNESELITIVETAENEGELNKHESQLIRSAIEFEDMDVRDVMIPRVNVVSISMTETFDAIYEVFREHGFSRLPVYTGTIDTIVGIIHEKDFFVLMREGKTDLKPILQSCVLVSSTMKISTVLRMLQKAKMHMAIVVDEFGGTEGIVTLEDILEELVGEIYDEHDEVEERFSLVGEHTYLVSGDENVEDMFEKLELPFNDDEVDSTTVSGFVTEMLDKIPTVGERFIYNGMEIEVTKATARHVVEIKVTVTPSDESEN